ncbi:aspartate dehydrogenase [Fervidobacterium thailandense]|uniref:L-aspartate dehydrogenase n=1 Tax=Fervidobacterium thailandense TaxID=1008305 RepID=A0A1E3G2Z1_9BACT|nr:aspartate dehydrogenase [Fervidobacterium thailandense]ODN30520.1 aspartate dehydrogenase [Fervidobacterium thailandense]
MKVFFIGGGNITRIVLEKLGDRIERCWYYDLEKKDIPCQFIGDKFYIPSEADVVVEAASVEAVKTFGIDVLKSGKDFYVISSGAFADEEFTRRFAEELKNSTSKVFVPSGAVGGIDIICALEGYLETVKLRTRKPPAAFGMDAGSISEPRVVFSGSVYDAIRNFPQNINVAVTLALAAKDFNKVNVEMLADPSISQNIHEVEISSSVGNYKLVLQNKPSPNPKTSYLAPLSLVAALKKRIEKFVVG